MRRALVLAALTLSACGDGVVATTTTAAPASATTEAVTTTTAATAVQLHRTGVLALTAGVEYRADIFWVPVAVNPDREGWRADGASELWIYLAYVEPGRASFDLDLSIVAHAPNSNIATIAANIAANEQVELIGMDGPIAATVSGHEALRLDIEIEESGIGGGYCGNDSVGNSRFQNNETGLVLMEDLDTPIYGYYFGVRSCRGARIWVVDVEGATITIIAASERPEMLDGLLEIAEAFVAGIEFGG